MAEGGGSVYGIVVGVAPSTGAWLVRMQRSSGSSTSTGFVTIATFKTLGTSTSYTDTLFNDGGIRNYRAQHYRSGYENGAWSTVVHAVPVNIGI